MKQLLSLFTNWMEKFRIDFMKKNRIRKLSNLEERSVYKPVWDALSNSEDGAKMHVSGFTDEAQYLASGEDTRRYLEGTVGISPNDAILEIGCGVGRVGLVIAPLCRQWTGCDVSKNMLKHAAKRLSKLHNVNLIEISGYDLGPIPDNSVDLVYCTVVFMHLEEWDRFTYVLESQRVLRKGGRIYIDNFNQCSDKGWAVFERHRSIPPPQRPAHISKSSTPQELENYLRRAGFSAVKLREEGAWVRAWGIK